MSSADSGPDFTAESLLVDDVCVVVVGGDVDLSTAARLTDELQRAASLQLPVVVDLRLVSFIDSAGLKALIGARRLLAAHDQPLAVAYAPESQPDSLFGLVAGEELFELHTTRAAAVQALQRQRRVERSYDERLELITQPDRQRVIVTPVGALDGAAVDTLAAKVHELHERGFDHVAVDLRTVISIDAACVDALVGLSEAAESGGYTLGFIRGTAAVDDAFRRLGALARLEDAPGA